jgi:hypothetical protein
MGMTAKEHELIVNMLAFQTATLKALCQVLESKGILEPGDLSAFAFVVGSEEQRDMGTVKTIASVYAQMAQKLGMNLQFSFEGES